MQILGQFYMQFNNDQLESILVSQTGIGWMNRSRVLKQVALVVVVLGGCTKEPPKPEFYGDYLRDGDDIIPLSESARLTDRSQQSEIFLYHKELSGELISASVKDNVKLYRTYFVRSQFLRSQDTVSSVHPVGTYERESHPVDVRYRPSGDPELVIIVPSQLANGRYELVFFERSFGFFIGASDPNDTSVCRDKGQDQALESCDFVNRFEGEWRSQAETAVSEEKWRRAYELASWILVVSPNDAVATEIKKTAGDTLAEMARKEQARREQEARRMAEEEARRRQELVLKSKQPTKTYGSFVASTRKTWNRASTSGTIVVTDVFIRGLRPREHAVDVTGSEDDTFWYCGLYNIGPIGEFLGTYNVRFNNGASWANEDIRFDTESDYQAFVASLTQALDEWNRNFGVVRSDYKCR